MPELQANRANNALMLQRLERLAQKKELKDVWPDKHVIGPDGFPVPFHVAQELTWDSTSRIVAYISGSQAGKTSFSPHWLKREIDKRGSGDYLAVTSSFQLFQKKFLPEFLRVFEDIYKLGRFWAGSQIFELKDPTIGEYWAKRVSDPMWGRVMLLSAQAKGGLESSTAKAAVLDEAGQEDFTIDAWRAIKRRLTLNRGRALITSTLYHLGWISTEIINKALDGGVVRVFEMGNDAAVEVTENTKENISLIQADSIINPTFPIEEYEDAKRTLPPDQFAMFYRGRTARPRFMIYDCFDEDAHCIPPFKIPDEWPRYIGLDFGAINTVATFWAEEPHTGRYFCYKEYKGSNRTAKDHVEHMLEGEPMRPIAYGGAKAEGQWRQEFREAGLPIREPKISDVWLGINKVYGAFQSKEIFIFNDLKWLREDCLNMRRKTDDSGNPTDEILNKSTWHWADSMRYAIGSLKRDRKVAIGFA